MPKGDSELEPRIEAVTLLVECKLAVMESAEETLIISVPLAAAENEAAPDDEGTSEALAQPLFVSFATVPEGCRETLPTAVLEVEPRALLETTAMVAVTAELTLPDLDAEAQADDESIDAEGPVEALARTLRDAATVRDTSVEAVGSGLSLLPVEAERVAASE